MKILILGAKGMLGSALAEEFKSGNEVLAWGREELDVADPEAMAGAITSDIDVIVNAAAMTDIDDVEGKLDEAMKVNARPAAALADICNVLGMTTSLFVGACLSRARQFTAMTSAAKLSRSRSMATRKRKRKNSPLTTIAPTSFALRDSSATPAHRRTPNRAWCNRSKNKLQPKARSTRS